MLRALGNLVLFRRNISALYVTGDKAMENCAVISPFLDIDDRLRKDDFEEIKQNIRARQMQKMDLESFKAEYELYQAIEKRKKDIEKSRIDIGNLIKKNPENSEGLIIKGKHFREELKKLKENSYLLEDQFIHNFLKLPNYLHNKTPKDGKKVIIFDHLTPPKNSLNISDGGNKRTDELVEHYDSFCQYLKGAAAEFDLNFPIQVSNYFSDRGYCKFSNPDFIRSVINEALLIDLNETFLIKEDNVENKLNLLHLSGNSSFQSFMPFITKLSTFSSQLPLKFVSTGKEYVKHQCSNVQSTSNQILIATNDDTSFDEIFEEQLDHIREIYQPLNLHFRVVAYPANELNLSECYKIGIEMISAAQQAYTQVGSFAYYGNMISKRLLFNAKNQKDFNFPFIYSGSIVNTTRLLLIMLHENNSFNID